MTSHSTLSRGLEDVTRICRQIPPDEGFDATLREALFEPIEVRGRHGQNPRQTTLANLIVERLIHQAMAGDLEAIQLIFDRVDGKPRPAEAPHTPPPEPLDAKGLDELARSIQKKMGLDEELDFDSEEEPGQED